MRWIIWMVMALIGLLSILFSALNATMVRIDWYFFQWHLPLGVLVLLSVLVGCLLGGMALYFSVILPLKLRQKRLMNAANSLQMNTGSGEAGEPRRLPSKDF